MAEVWFKVGINYAFIHKNYRPDYEGKQGFLLQGSGGCFYKNQKVVTDKGSKLISNINIGDRVLSFNEKTKKKEFKLVRETFVHQNTKKCYKLTLKNGEKIIATEDHKFYYEGAWITLKHLLYLWNDKKSNNDRG